MIPAQRNLLIITLLFSGYLIFPHAGHAQLPVFPPGKDGAEALIRYILSASPEARRDFSRTLYPSLSDCVVAFDTAFGTEVYHYERKIKRKYNPVVRPMLQDQYTYLIWSATTEELTDYTGEASFFPGGYHEIANHMAPGLSWYRFKFIEPGRKVGSAYDVLVYVNGHWCMIHRPWAVMFRGY
ncbi:MAG: hypothetical protein SF053_22305 [Bacteroidia bacterium]|nr:hypothetical protein [Bacteroidia bacterium]